MKIALLGVQLRGSSGVVGAWGSTTVCGLILLCLGFLLPGCGSQPEPTDNTTQKVSAGETEAEKCRARLASAIARLQPAEFATLSNKERAVNGLNAWLASCAASRLESLKLTEDALAMLSSDAQRLVSAGRYTANDASYVSDCLLLRTLGEELASRSNEVGNDLSRVVAAFEFVVRTVNRLPPDSQRVPIDLTDVLLTGQGTPDDRAWIFAELLRQMQIDAFRLIPSGTAGSDASDILETASSLVVVVLQDRTALFDPVSGQAVPRPEDDSVFVTDPAEIGALKGLDRWNGARAQIIAQASAFSPRMLVLQEQLAAKDSAVLYEELTGGTSEIRPLVIRLAEAVPEYADRQLLSVWSYPGERVAAASSLRESEQKQYAALMSPFDAPFEQKTIQASESLEDIGKLPEELTPEEREARIQMRLSEELNLRFQSGEEFGRPSQRLLKTRIQQVMGKSDVNIIQEYQQIRIASIQEYISLRVPNEVHPSGVLMIPLPSVIRNVNQSATGTAMFWTGMCQIDRGEYGTAITTLQNYRRLHPDGQWIYSSLINQSLSELRQERTEAAVKTLISADVKENPERDRVRLLLQRISD